VAEQNGCLLDEIQVALALDAFEEGPGQVERVDDDGPRFGRFERERGGDGLRGARVAGADRGVQDQDAFRLHGLLHAATSASSLTRSSAQCRMLSFPSKSSTRAVQLSTQSPSLQ